MSLLEICPAKGEQQAVIHRKAQGWVIKLEAGSRTLTATTDTTHNSKATRRSRRSALGKENTARVWALGNSAPEACETTVSSAVHAEQ